ncbi:MAG TPA: SNF2-related protein [Polyangiaceae bacterium LLY-WYZ-14_1]|nr:SNF2-related protein [Polyangiaceae bacterium LLY-WYZ-14_1]
MADSPLVERKSEPKSPPSQDISQVVGKMSDRAIQRVVGGNAFLRGRLYARRGSVEDLHTTGRKVGGKIKVRSADEPYKIEVALDEEGKFLSSCTCPGWRGPTSPGHCKHVAALLVALRDRERPPRPKDDDGGAGTGGAGGGQGQTNGQRKDRRNGAQAQPPQTVTVGGKRRRSRRRRRGADGPGAEGVGRESGSDARHAGEAWLPPDAQPKPHDFEYRMAVRPASLTVTPVLAGSRTSVPIADALGGFNTVAPSERPLLRALGRFTSRGQPAQAEVRGEDAAEILGMLQGHRVLLEPASMELRFADEPLKPKVELDSNNGDAVRVRVVFEAKQGSRRFPLSSGAWFEGTPGWHIDTTEGVARPLAEAVTPAWLQRLYRSPALVYPLHDLPRLLTDFVPRVAASLAAELPDLTSVADLVDASPRIQLKASGDLLEARVRLQVAYGPHEFPIPANELPPPLAFLPPDEDADDERPRVVRRDVGAEMAAVQAVMNLRFEVDPDDGDVLLANGDDAVAFWTEGIGSLPEDWDRFIPDDLVDVTIRDQTVTPQMRVTSGVDWLDLDMRFDAGGVAVDEKELEECLARGRRLVRLSDGTYAPVDPDAVSEVLSRMAEIVATSGQRKKIPLSQAGRVQDLMRIVSDSSVTTGAKQLFKKLDDIGEVESVAKPRNLKATLRDYQKKGFSWLVFLNKLGTGGVLADDMGLGKTLQTIALLVWAKAKSKGKGPSLVVAPTSVVSNWQREIERFAPSLNTMVWQGPDRFDRQDELPDADVVLTSYALLRRDGDLLQGLDLDYVILDEAQHIKNPLSTTARVAKKLQSAHRLALTGTPIENRLSEFWSIVDFVAPGLLGDLRTFEEKVARPIDRGDEETAAKLRATIRPFVLRRTKEEVAPELPEKIEQEYVVPMSEEQGKLYRQILRQVRDSVMSEIDEKGLQKSQIQILAALTRLRQVACDPRLLKLENGKFDPDRENGESESGKLGALVEIVQEAQSGGHKVLVFSQFVEMLKLIRSALDDGGITYEYLDGSTKNRTERVDRFNDDPSVTAFLISLKAGGTGLNLVGADTVVHFDPWWNPAVEDQATDRAHRIGQTKVVSVYRLIARGTVEEKILQLSAKKRALVENVLSVEGSPLKGLTRADIDDLFS